MFKKKDGDAARNGSQDDKLAAPPLKPFSKHGSHAPSKPAASSASGYRTEVPRRIADIPGVQRRSDRARGSEADGKKLTVGREICLSGEIASCDTLVVEGRVEATLHNAQVIDVAPSGLFKGEATVREAEISGRFEGTLTARDVLTVRPGGKVGGKIRYGRIVIESGGEVAGEMRSLAETEET